MKPDDARRELQTAFEKTGQVVQHPLLFKAQLGIGADVYLSQWLGKRLHSAFALSGAGAAGASVASSGVVASTFFSSSGWLAALGLGGAAITPVGWVATAAVASAGLYYGVAALARDASKGTIRDVPEFINSPLDVLAVCLFDLLAPLGLKVASADGRITDDEIEELREYFISDWGYDAEYVDGALIVLTKETVDIRLDELTNALKTFAKENPDCNLKHIESSLIGFLKDLAMSDGVLCETEEMAIERVTSVLGSRKWFSLNRRG